MTQYKANFIALFQTWSMTHFAAVPNGGLLAATALDIAVNVDEETLVDSGLLRGKTAMAAVIDLVGFLMDDHTDNPVVLIDSHEVKRWEEACRIFHYDVHDNVHSQRESV